MTVADVTGLFVGALCGAAVGVERQWSGHAEGPDARFAGIRTFTMLGGIGALVSLLWTAGLAVSSAIVLAGAVGLVVAGYASASRFDVDGTTEVAALVVLTAGLLAGIGFIRLACGIIAVATLLLAEKTRLHALVRRIDDVGFRSGVRFAVLALVVLPLLPEGPYGPFGGVRPRELWAIVLLFSGLSFAGYLARRLFGPRNGYTVTGILGGVVSSTNVTLTFAQLSRSEPALARTLAFGAVGASAMLYPRLLAATAILNSALLVPLLPYLIPQAVVAIAITAFGLWRSESSPIESVAPSNPLQLRQALQFAVLIQIVLVVVYVARERWGAAGIFSSAAALGLTDVDALTVSMARDVARTVSTGVAAAAIAIGVLTNTAAKLALALIFGDRRFRMIAGSALVLILAAAGIALAIVG